MSEIKTQSILTFLDDLASKSATPGGGSVAALLGAQGAALVSMVCRLTVDKPKFADVHAELNAVLRQAEHLRGELTALIQADVDVFNRLMSKYALPKETDADKAARSQAIQEVLKDAIDVPMQCAIHAKAVIDCCKVAAELGNPSVVSDAGAGVMAAYAAFKTSALNVYINAASLKDKEFANAKLAELEQISEGMEALVGSIYQTVKQRL